MQDAIDNAYQVEQQQVRDSFNDAAKNYDANALLQNTVTNRLMESFEHIKVKPSSILDLGSGTGYGSKLLKKQFKKAHIYQADLSVEMLKGSRRKSWSLFSKNRFICADANQIPLTENSIELVFSSLMLQWCNNPDAVFSEIRRVLKPDGVFVFTTFGPGTLRELRESWRQVDDDIHVNAFTDMHDIGDALIRNGLDSPVLNVEDIVFTYDECKQLMRELKSIGAHNVNAGRRKTLTGKKRLQEVIKYYEKFRQNKKLPASYEVIYGHAWKSEAQRKSQEHSVSLDDLKKDLKSRKLNNV